MPRHRQASNKPALPHLSVNDTVADPAVVPYVRRKGSTRIRDRITLGVRLEIREECPLAKSLSPV
jgi:hypothetical protein